MRQSAHLTGVLTVLVAAALSIGYLWSTPATAGDDPRTQMEREHRRLLHGECRTIPPGEFYTTEQALRDEAYRKLTPEEFPSVSERFMEKWRAGKAGAAVYTPLCMKDQERVWKELRGRGMSEELMYKLHSSQQEEAARLRKPLLFYTEMYGDGPGVSTRAPSAVGVNSLSPSDIRLGMSMQDCLPSERIGDHCKISQADWDWVQSPLWRMTDKLAFSWSQSWSLAEGSVRNSWREWGCVNYVYPCHLFDLWDHSAYDTILDNGTSVEIDLGVSRVLADETYAIMDMWGAAHIKTYKHVGACPCRTYTMQTLGRYYYKQVGPSGTFTYSRSPSIALVPGWSYNPSYDVWRSYLYQDHQ